MSTQVDTRSQTTEGSTGRDDGGRKLRRILQYGVLGVLTLLFISPLLYMLSTAFKSTGDAASAPPV